MKGLLVLGGKPGMSKKPGMPEEPLVDEPSESSERQLAREAFAALRDDDEEGFVEAFVSAVEACSGKAENGEYEAEE